MGGPFSPRFVLDHKLPPIKHIESGFIDDRVPRRRPKPFEGVAPGERKRQGLAARKLASVTEPGDELAYEVKEDKGEQDGGDDGHQKDCDHFSSLVTG